MTMDKYLGIIEELEESLTQLRSETDNLLIFSERAVSKSKIALLRMRDIVVNQGFENSSEEIEFFKTIKPQVYSKLLYYARLFNIESKRPSGCTKVERKYLVGELGKIQTFINDNLEFYQYYRCNITFLDDRFFVRGKADIRLCLDSLHFLTDEHFSTSHDHSVASIKAFDMLSVYLKKEIKLIDSRETIGLQADQETIAWDSKLFWTDTKKAAIELIYALHSAKSINSGKVDIKELASAFERILHIDLGDLYHGFIEIRLRKKERTKYIDNLKDSLIQRMDEADEL
jgi:hypothetical protein